MLNNKIPTRYPPNYKPISLANKKLSSHSLKKCPQTIEKVRAISLILRLHFFMSPLALTWKISTRLKGQKLRIIKQ